MDNTPTFLEQFADNLITKAGYDKLSEQFRQDFKEQIMSEALTRLGMMITAEMPEDKLEEYGQLVNASEDPAADPKLGQFTAQAIPDFEAKSAKVLGAYMAEFLKESQKALGK